MKKFYLLALMCIALVACSDNYPKVESSLPYTVVNGTIVLDEPARQPGQESMKGVACEPLQTVRVGLVGAGGRGRGNMGVLMQIEGVEITAVCDLYQDHVDLAQKSIEKAGRPKAREYVGAEAYKQLCEADDIDLVYICTGWQMHTPVAVYALDHGKHAAIEVPAATSIKECWDLVDASERNRRHCMILENCCYDKFELLALNMKQQGLLGEVFHGEGAYIHNLNPFWAEYTDSWRLAFNVTHSGDNYPTHGLGPVCQSMDINRGDKMNKLVAMSTKAMNSAEVAMKYNGNKEIAEGDQVVTLISTENGHEILIQHNVYGARPYNRLFMISGTKGLANKYPFEWFAVDSKQLPDVTELEKYNPEMLISGMSESSKEAFDYLKKTYEHPVWTEHEQRALEVGGHGGMDYILNSRLIYCLRNGLPLDIDVYDAAQWSCPVELSALSINSGFMPVQVPDFTRGDWNKTNGITFAHK